MIQWEQILQNREQYNHDPQSKLIKHVEIAPVFNTVPLLQKITLTFIPKIKIGQEVYKITPEQFNTFEELDFIFNRKVRKCSKKFKAMKTQQDLASRQLSLDF